MAWHHRAITNEVVTLKTRYKDPHISEGAGRTFIPEEQITSKLGVRDFSIFQRDFCLRRTRFLISRRDF